MHFYNYFSCKTNHWTINFEQKMLKSAVFSMFHVCSLLASSECRRWVLNVSQLLVSMVWVALEHWETLGGTGRCSTVPRSSPNTPRGLKIGIFPAKLAIFHVCGLFGALQASRGALAIQNYGECVLECLGTSQKFLQNKKKWSGSHSWAQTYSVDFQKSQKSI